MLPPANKCDAACQKVLLDAGMAKIAAALYRDTIGRAAGFRPIDYLAPQFFIDASTLFEESARLFLAQLPSHDDEALLLAQLQQQCYRADNLIAWSNLGADSPELIAAWTAKLFKWAKEDQKFFLKLTAGVELEG